MLGGRHDARSGAFSFAGERGCSVCAVNSDRVCAGQCEGEGGEGGGRGGGGGGGEGGGGEGGEGGGGGGGEGGRQGREGGWGGESPSHRQPKSIGGGETSLPDLGAHLWVHTEAPPPPPKRVVWRGGSGEGIKRWGIEGIRIGTSDRFGRGPRRI